jgi:hypothetical protein
MTIDPISLARMFLLSLVCGAALELLWECFGFIGCVVKYRKKGSDGPAKDNPVGLVLIFIKDILFFTVAGAIVAVFVYWTNDGQFRFLALAGLFTGFLCCRRTLGRLLRRLNEQLVKLIFAFLGILIYPVRKVFYFASLLLNKAAQHERRRRMKRYTIRKIKELDIIEVQGYPK